MRISCIVVYGTGQHEINVHICVYCIVIFIHKCTIFTATVCCSIVNWLFKNKKVHSTGAFFIVTWDSLLLLELK